MNVRGWFCLLFIQCIGITEEPTEDENRIERIYDDAQYVQSSLPINIPLKFPANEPPPKYSNCLKFADKQFMDRNIVCIAMQIVYEAPSRIH